MFFSKKNYSDKEIQKIHHNAFNQKKILRNVFKIFYQNMLYYESKFAIKSDSFSVEIGSGYGFLSKYKDKIISSDIFYDPSLDLIFDAQSCPFKKNSIRSFFAINVLHHIQDPEKFFESLNNSLMEGGCIILIEPSDNLLSNFIHSNIHNNEFYDKNQKSWKNNLISSRLNGANQALAYIIFERDKKLFEKKYPSLSLVTNNYINNSFGYIVSGGVNFHQLLPDFMYPIVRLIEKLLSPMKKYWSLHKIYVLSKIKH